MQFKKSLTAGFSLAFLTFFLIYILDEEREGELLAVIMTLIGAVYYVFAFKETDKTIAITEIVVSTLFVFTAILGLWVSLWFIFAGLVLHGFWDLLHHNFKKKASIPSWYIPFCVIYDWLTAGIVLFIIIG